MQESSSATREPYWSERQGRGPKATPLDFDRLKRMVFGVFDHLGEEAYLQYGFGYECVDAGPVPGHTGSNPNAWFLRTIERDKIWPYRTEGIFWDADTLLDVVEVVHDLCAAPTDGHFHGYMDCGYHATEFDHERGQAHYREQLNPILARYEEPFELNEKGRLVELAPSEFRPLLDAPVPTAEDPDTETRVSDAVELFRARGASKADRRRAVRDLVEVLEPLRKDIGRLGLPKDESELFHLANRFAIRHNNREQRGQYDDVIWLSWAFYVYLATIHAVLRLQARERRSGST